MDMEKIYLTMKRTGAGNIVLGILSICIGLASGIMLIITGANLLNFQCSFIFLHLTIMI